MKRPIRSIILWTIISISFLIFGNCKKKKGIDSTEWKDESLKITAKLCEKYRACADENWIGVPDKLKDFTKSRLEESHCQKEFRDSNAYRLIGGDPKVIIESYRECKNKIISATCNSLKNGLVDSIPECKVIKKIQSGT